MKNIKLILVSAVVCALLASCGMNTAKTKPSPTPSATEKNNVSDTGNGNIEENTTNTAENAVDKTGDAAQDVGNAAGNVARDAGDAVGDVAEKAGDVAEDTIEGAGDAVGMNDANGNGE